MAAVDPKLAERALELAPGCYVERDGGPWYVLTPNDDRLGEDFADRHDAMQFLCWLGGDPIPEGWAVVDLGLTANADLQIPNRRMATIWLREVAKRFPNWTPQP